jgi:hypothetical protein
MIEPSSYRENGLLITSLFGSTLSFLSVLNNLIIKALYSIITVMFLCEVHKDIFMKGHFILFFLDPQSLCRPLYEHVPCPIRRFSFLYFFFFCVLPSVAFSHVQPVSLQESRKQYCTHPFIFHNF